MSKLFNRSELKDIAQSHRLVLWSLLAGIVISLLRFSGIDPQLGNLLYIAAALFQIFSLFRLGTALKLSAVLLVLLIIGLFIPIVSLFILLYMHSEAMRVLKQGGVNVGFMGADPNSI
ncbi:hypothetical protein H6G89_29960 [Oscillatoria sp. FACHB-1407]|uniref:hypothetical protein n=1 Tax=Oscillatoria sp. FACHB-1407 TaxID=2692847 RepID=UPI0016868786|nr:hypothetical protein [Oscillatoria sp. FACHB-1407]MBD2465239.1 hypothetical protein [Oscillatoria sp. FACHB-1407]